ncbi:MAG: HNH endonuclease [Jiangellaceae bacterium]
MEFDLDDEMRAAAFLYLERQRDIYGDRIPWKVLQAFEFDGRRRALITQRGIRWVSGMPALTFTTTYSPDPTRAPYADGVGEDGFPRYKYQGTEPARADNVSMKLAERLGKPLIWFVGTGVGVYAATYPVYVVGQDDAALEFTVALDEEQRALWDEPRVDPATRRRYAERLTRQRLHQPIFRSQVLRAYETQCTICRLRHAPLLDAAHILSDAEGGQPVVSNGMAMCKIHHAAYDQHLISVTSGYRIAVLRSVLEEFDGPMLRHGLQEIDGLPIQLPKRRAELPDRDLLAQRHARFVTYGGAPA